MKNTAAIKRKSFARVILMLFALQFAGGLLPVFAQSTYPVYVTSTTPALPSHGSLPPGWTLNIWIQPLPNGNANSGSYFASPDGSQKQGDLPPAGAQVVFGPLPNTLPTPIPTPTPLATPTPSGTPSGTPQPTPTATPLPGSGIADTLANIAIEAQKKLSEASELIQSLFAPTIWYLGGAVSAVMIVLSIAKLIAEDDGNPTRPLFLFIRIMICTALFSQITPILNGFEDAKTDVLDKFKTLQGPPAGIGSGPIQNVSPTQLARLKFELTYKKFTDVYFKELQPDASGTSSTEDAKGKLWDPNKPWQTNIDRAVSPNEWNAPKLYAALTIFRGLLSFCDLAIEIIYGLVRLALILFAPIMCAVAIDKQLFNQITMTYIKGLIVFYLIWPAVADIIRMLAYMFSTITIESFMTPMIKETLRTTAAGNSIIHVQYIADFNGYAVVASCVIMLVCTLSLLASPAISYKMSMGQVFESVSATVAGWIGAIAGQAAELYGAKVSADLENMARVTEIQAGRDSSYTQAGARRQAADLGVQGSQYNSRVSAMTQYRSTSSGLSAENQRAITMLGAGNQQQRTNLLAGATANAGRTQAGAALSRGQTDVERQRSQVGTNIDVNTQTDLNRRIAGYEVAGGITNGIPVASGLVNAVKTPIVTKETNDNLRRKGAMQTELAGNVQGAQNTYIDQNATTQVGLTQQEMVQNTAAADAYMVTGTEANNAYTGTMLGVASTNLTDLNEAADKVAGLGMQGNEIIMKGDIKSADINFAASNKAADLHWMSQFIGAATRDIDRTLQEALALNY